MSRERPRVPMYRCRTAMPRPKHGGLRNQTPGHELIDAAPFLAWLDRRYETIRRMDNELPAIRGERGGVRSDRVRRLTDSGRRVTPSSDYTPRLMLSIGWNPDTGMRKWTHWRNGGLTDNWRFTGWVPRDTVETALLHAGLRFEDIYPLGWDAPTLPWLARTLILQAIVDAIETRQAREWATTRLAAKPPQRSFALIAAVEADERWDVAL